MMPRSLLQTLTYFSTNRAIRREPYPLTIFFLLCAALLIWLGATLNLRPLTNPDEGRYVSVAWEMLRSGQWLTPTLDGLPYFHKPPLFYWITALSLKLNGTQEWAVRVAPLTGALVMALSVFYFLRRHASPGLAQMAVLILASSPFFYSGAQFANHDMLVAGFITATILLFADAIMSIRNHHACHLPLLAGWTCAALGLLSKGLIGMALPCGVLVCWLMLEGELPLLKRLCWWPGLLLFAAIALPWFVAMAILHSGFLHYFFIEQQWHRYVGTQFNNKQAFWFLPAALFVLNLPWSILLYTRLSLPRECSQRIRSLRRLFWVWLILIVVFFSIPASKLVGYLLPVQPALAILIAEGITVHPQWTGMTAWRLPCLSLLAGLLCIAGITGAAMHDTKSSRQLADIYLHHARPDEPLLFVATYPFDLIYYAKTPSPVMVVDDWEQARQSTIDNWRKELLDAARFAPAAANTLLLPYAAISHQLCMHPASWIVTSATGSFSPVDVVHADMMGKNERIMLWRVMRSAIDCDEK